MAHMKIAILGYSWLGPSHLERLRAIGEVVEYKSTTSEEAAIERLAGVQIAVADQWDTPLSRKVFENAPELKYLTLNSTGFDRTDIAAAKACGIHVANIPGFSTDAVAEFTLGLALATTRHMIQGDSMVRAKPFQVDPANETHQVFQGFDLRGKTWGVIGLGQIGIRVAEIAQGMGMRVLGYNRSAKEVSGVEVVPLEKLLEESDVVSLHLALTEDQHNLMGKENLARMRPHAILVNTARGAFIDEHAVAEALTSGRLGGFGSDFLVDYSSANPLLTAPNTTLTPHSGFFTKEALENLAEIVVTNIESYAKGVPANVVNV